MSCCLFVKRFLRLVCNFLFKLVILPLQDGSSNEFTDEIPSAVDEDEVEDGDNEESREDLLKTFVAILSE